MSAILLSVHIIVAILAVGPIAVAAVPVLGFATAIPMGVLTQAWVLVSIALSAVAAVVLVAIDDRTAGFDDGRLARNAQL